MFTFGRDHEVKHVLGRYGGKETIDLLVSVVNTVHDLIENKASLGATESSIKSALIDGKSGIWEKAGGWLLKVNQDFPSSISVWRELAQHPSASVRFRVASFLIDFPRELRKELYEGLRNDKSKKVREHAEGKWEYCEHPENYA